MGINFGDMNASASAPAPTPAPMAPAGMTLDLSMVAPDVQSIVFAVAIYDAVNRRQTFGMVNNSYVRLLDKDSNNKELCHFILKDDYSTDTAVVFAKLVRNGSEWDFVTIGDGKQADLTGLLQLFS